MIEDQDVNTLKPSSFNQTAYRILLLLLWLSEKSLTFEEINERFKVEPEIGKQVSTDTLWLYLNTLKELGCQISRPMPSNDFHYQLTYHPFTHFLTPQDINILKESLQHIDERLSYWDVIHFNHWLKRVLQTCANKDRDQLAQQLFLNTRIMDYEALKHLIYELEYHCCQQQLLQIRYQSSSQGSRNFCILPQKVFHHQGILYLLGYAEDREKASMLRLDKIEHAAPYDNLTLHQALLQRQWKEQVFILRLLHCSPEQYVPLTETDETLADPTATDHLLVKINTDNEFLLKQKLLASGYRFQVLYPQGFQREMNKTLDDMRQLYLS